MAKPLEKMRAFEEAPIFQSINFPFSQMNLQYQQYRYK